jgi:hypothetical protein
VSCGISGGDASLVIGVINQRDGIQDTAQAIAVDDPPPRAQDFGVINQWVRVYTAVMYNACRPNTS